MKRAYLSMSLIFCAVLAVCWQTPSHAQLFKPRDKPTAEPQNKPSAQDENKGGLIKVSWPSFPAPKITMPEIKPPTIKVPRLPSPWSKSGEKRTSPFEPIEKGARKVSDGTRQAWGGFKGMFSPSQDKQPPTRAKKDKQRPPFWKRLLSPEPERKPPQTVSEWMAQPRLDH